MSEQGERSKGPENPDVATTNDGSKLESHSEEVPSLDSKPIEPVANEYIPEITVHAKPAKGKPGRYVVTSSNAVGTLHINTFEITSDSGREAFAKKTLSKALPDKTPDEWPKSVHRKLLDDLQNLAVVPPGSQDPPDQVNPLVDDSRLPPHGVMLDDPHWLASRFLKKYQSSVGLRLRYWRQEFYLWRDGCYFPFSDDDLKGVLSAFIEDEFNYNHEHQRKTYNPLLRGEEPVKCKVSSYLIRDVLLALKSNKSNVPVPSDRDAPSWLRESDFDSATLVAMPNGILDISRMVNKSTDYLLSSSTGFFHPESNRIRIRPKLS